MEEIGVVDVASTDSNLSSKIELRKKNVLKWLKKNPNWLFGILVSVLVAINVWIRTRGLPGLRDVTTGGWTLVPDLDPFLFLRWAKYIVANGSLMAVDTLRYVPLGFVTKNEYYIFPYLIAGFHKIAALFGSVSVEESAVIFPVIMFSLTIVFLFLFTRKLFKDEIGEKKASWIGIIAGFFFLALPVLITRTVGGEPDKQGCSFFFIFLCLYLFLCAWKSKKLSSGIIFASLAALSTAIFALCWGGYGYVFIIIAVSAFVIFLLGNVHRKEIYIYSLWLIPSLILMRLLSPVNSISNLLSSTEIAIPIFIFLLFGVYSLFFFTKLKDKIPHKYSAKLPASILSLIITVILVIVLSLVFLGFPFLYAHASYIVTLLISPVHGQRINLTVAENAQPYLTDIMSSFGPFFLGIPIFFTLFSVGSVYLFYRSLEKFEKKEKIKLTIGFVLLISALFFSRYSSSSFFNGTNGASILFYFSGFAVFAYICGTVGYYGFKKGQTEKFKSISFSLLLLLTIFILFIISARGAIRLVMMLAPAGSIIVGYFIVVFTSSLKSRITKNSDKDNSKKMWPALVIGILLIATIYAGYSFFQESSATAQGYVPSAYTQQWQKAMAWVRNNTSTDAVFAHWWDYGYWVQTLGERATILDGGNVYGYWDYLMGRHVLTGANDAEALAFLYAHNATNLLIDSTDIGKYSAFSSIADENNDRTSWIPTFVKDPSQTHENGNSTIFVYPGGMPLDEDITYNSTTLPQGNSGVLGVTIEMNSNNSIISQPIGVYTSQASSYLSQKINYQIPIRYVYENGKLTDYGSGVGGIFLIPSIISNGNSQQVDQSGALLYLSNKVVTNQFSRLYLYDLQDPNFQLVHSEDDFIVAQLKAQHLIQGDFVLYGDIHGPIRIWQIHYPSNIVFDKSYLDTSYPNGTVTL